MKSTPRSDGSFFYGPDWVVMSFEYIDNQLSREKLAEIDQEAKNSPKSHGMKFFYMRNHYSNLREYQQFGIHWFYLAGEGKKFCTCGLTVEADAKVETSLGHREIPGAKEVTFVFISCFDWDPKQQAYRLGAYCQLCKKGSLRNLSKEEVTGWIACHKEDCPERDKYKVLS